MGRKRPSYPLPTQELKGKCSSKSSLCGLCVETETITEQGILGNYMSVYIRLYTQFPDRLVNTSEVRMEVARCIVDVREYISYGKWK